MAARPAQRGQEQPLATLPEELGHFSLDNFRDRAVQADLVALLLLPKGDPSFASCVLVHGMGGTGKVSKMWYCHLSGIDSDCAA